MPQRKAEDLLRKNFLSREIFVKPFWHSPLDGKPSTARVLA
jgi:hypothetical protein